MTNNGTIKCPHCQQNINEVYEKFLIWQTYRTFYTKDTDQILFRLGNDNAQIKTEKIDNRNGYYCPLCDKLITKSKRQLRILFRGGTLKQLAKSEDE